MWDRRVLGVRYGGVRMAGQQERTHGVVALGRRGSKGRRAVPRLGSGAVGKKSCGRQQSDKTEEPRHPAARHLLAAALPHFICIIKASSDG